MKAQEDILIRKIPKDVLQRLDVKAKQANFKSRQTYLLEILTQLSLDELRLDAEDKYNYLLEELKDILIINTELIQTHYEILNEHFDVLNKVSKRL